MNKESIERLVREEGVTFKELDELYRQCKQSLDEFFHVFHNKTDSLNKKDLGIFLNLAQMQGISKDIQALSSRVIELEGKIESVSKTLTDCEKNQGGHCVACDRKTLPISMITDLRPKGMPDSRCVSTPSDTPFMIPETQVKRKPPAAAAADKKKGALRGGHNATTKLKTPAKNRKEVTWSRDSVDSSDDGNNKPKSSSSAAPNKPPPVDKSPVKADQKHSREHTVPAMRDSSTMTTPSPKNPHPRHCCHHHKCGVGCRTPTSSSSSTSEASASAAVAPSSTINSDSYEKVYKLIPELLSKFEEFHHSFSRACDADKHIEPSTAADILKVMDGHLKLLESLEARLQAQQCKTGKRK